jgi:hypothetical protein
MLSEIATLRQAPEGPALETGRGDGKLGGWAVKCGVPLTRPRASIEIAGGGFSLRLLTFRVASPNGGPRQPSVMTGCLF